MSATTSELPIPWQFYLGLNHPGPRGDWFSSALEPLSRPERLWQEFPLILTEDNERIALPKVLFTALDQLEEQGKAARIIAAYRFHFLKAAVDNGPEFWRSTVFKAFATLIDLSAAGKEELKREWLNLKPLIPLNGRLLLPDHALPLRLYRHRLAAHQEQPRARCLNKLRGLISRLEDLLRVEDGKQPADAQTLQASLGKSGTLFATATMAQVLNEPKGAGIMSHERRERVGVGEP